MLKRFSLSLLKLMGWSVDDQRPDDDRYVLVVAHHTSNWDFIIGLLGMWSLEERYRFVAKHTLFRGPLGYLFRGLGGIPVDRRARTGFIERMVDQFNQRDDLKLAILPEGTRSKVYYWKTGFYYIAVQADVPIAFGYLDYNKRRLGVGGSFRPSGDIHRDMDVLRQFYETKTGKRPEHQGDIRLHPDHVAGSDNSSSEGRNR